MALCWTTLLFFGGIVSLIVVLGFVFGIAASAIMILCFSAFFGAYLAQAYTTSFQIAKFAKATSMILGLVGIIMLFIATDWKLGLAGIAGHWLLFTISRLFWYNHFKSKSEEGKYLLHDLDRLEHNPEQAPDKEEEKGGGKFRFEDVLANMSTEDLLKLKDKYKSVSSESMVKVIDGVLASRAKKTEEA